MNIIVLAAGKGQRFKDAGYIGPKALIDVLGEPMVECVINNVLIDSSPIVLVRKEEESFYKDRQACIYPVSSVKDGVPGSGSALLNLYETQPWIFKGEILIVNCDQLVESGATERAVNHFINLGADGGVIVVHDKNKDSRSSHVDLREDGTISYFYEKSNCGPNASKLHFMDVGIVYWKSGEALIDCINQDIKIKLRINGEYCHGPAFNTLIYRRGNVVPYFVNEFHNLGTPEGLTAYLNKDK